MRDCTKSLPRKITCTAKMREGTKLKEEVINIKNYSFRYKDQKEGQALKT